MENCKYCHQELEEGTTLCPHCGKDNAETEIAEETPVVEELPVEEPPVEETPAEEISAEEPQKKATPGKIALAVAAVVVLVAVLIALIAAGVKGSGAEEVPAETNAGIETTVPATVPADGNPDDVTAKGTYTVTDEEAQNLRDTVVATIGGHELTNGQLQVYYWSAVNSFFNSQQGYYLMMYGAIDPSQPLDTQLCAVDESLTWQQQFLQQALNNWRTSCAMAAEAEKAGMEMSEEDRAFLDNLESYLSETAEKYAMSVEELLLRNVGPGAGMEEFVTYNEDYSNGGAYYEAELAKLVPTQEELEAFFDAHGEEYAQGGITKDSKFVNVRHILATVKSSAEDGTYSDEDWAACEAEAQAILDAWMAGDKTEDSFAALANEKSEDPGSNTNGGLYENVFVGQMVKPFEEWCFDADRAYGDTGLVRTDYGYHVMYYVSSAPQWEYVAKEDWLLEKTNEMIENLVEAYPMEVSYDKIALGYLELG